MLKNASRGCVAALAALSICACGGNPVASIPTTGSQPLPNLPAATMPGGRAMEALLRPHASGLIKHVVIIVQENRSFDNLFQGFPGADTRNWGYTSSGTKVTLQPIGLETGWDIDHSSGAYFAACNGKGSVPGTQCRMNGFDQEWAGCYNYCPYNPPQYGYVPSSESGPYFAIAKQYVLADRMFSSNFDASSFISHQYIIAGQAHGSVDYPGSTWGCDGGSGDQIGTVTQSPPRQYGPSQVVCFDPDETLGDELDAAGKTWRYYAASIGGDGDIWSAYQAVKHIRYGPDWTRNISSPQTNFFYDLKTGHMADVSWVTPTCEHSDHAGCGSNTGPFWVTSLVNAVGKSKYWNSTAIFIMWDDYGGWYDHVPPPYVDYDGLGMRIPLVIISPYARLNTSGQPGYVSHVQYEHGSILRFVEDQFGLPRMTASDSRAHSPETDCFNFSQSPRPFTAFPTPLTEDYFMREKPDHRVPDAE